MKARVLCILSCLIILTQVVSCKKNDIVTPEDNPENTTGDVSPAKYYAEDPDIANCFAGSLSDAAKFEVRDYINYIRSLHGLLPVSYDKNYDLNVQNAALIIVANDNITHDPGTSSFCYTEVGADGSGKSNLSYGYGNQLNPRSNKSVVNDWMTELNNTADVVGHRRWILDPFLKKISFGRVEGAPKNNTSKFVTGFALYVMNPDSYKNINSTTADFVAYPHNSYPSGLFNKDCYLSFSAIVNKADKWSNKDVDFSGAVIKVFEGQTETGIHSVSYDNGGYGLPNSIQWKLNSFKVDTKYTVKITNVIYKATSKDYQYSFQVKG